MPMQPRPSAETSSVPSLRYFIIVFLQFFAGASTPENAQNRIRQPLAAHLDCTHGGIQFGGFSVREVHIRHTDIFEHVRHLRGAEIGTIHGFCAISQARAICAGVASFCAPPNPSTMRPAPDWR